MKDLKLTVKDIAEIGIFVGMAIILDKFVKIPLGATGGSINLAALPLFIIALRHGFWKGFIASGVVYGLIECLLDGYGIGCYPAEYLIAFGFIGFIGLFGKKIYSMFNESGRSRFMAFVYVVLTCILWFVVRTACATFDSVVLWKYDFAAALIYNIPYVGFSALGVCVVLCLLLPAIMLANKHFPTDYLK